MVQYFFDKCKQKHDRPNLRLSPDVLPAFAAYRWPGNIRQLENLIERLILLSDGNEIRMNDLPEHMRTACATDDELLRIELPDTAWTLRRLKRNSS